MFLKVCPVFVASSHRNVAPPRWISFLSDACSHVEKSQETLSYVTQREFYRFFGSFMGTILVGSGETLSVQKFFFMNQSGILYDKMVGIVGIIEFFCGHLVVIHQFLCN